MGEKQQETATIFLEDKVYRDILKGVPVSTIIDRIEHDYYKSGLHYSPKGKSQSARNLLTRVRKKMKADYEEERKHLRETTINRLHNLYNECMDNLDRQTALNTIKYIGKITGMEEPQKVEVNLNGQIEIDFINQ